LKSEPIAKEALMILKHGERGTVEFVLDLDAAELPHLVGSWDGWLLPGIPMARQQGEAPAWRAVVQLAPGEHQFRYRIGSHWFSDPSADRYVDNGLGGDNSVVIIEEAPKKAGRRSSVRRARTKRRSQ
jgi:hypothetical protein